jgi:AraC family ethanolamine operon transcriptional activator
MNTEIHDALMQARMQPWVEMECYQLGQGERLAHMERLDLGGQQVVRESQTATVQKLGVTPPDLCTISCCTIAPTFRFTEFCVGDTEAIFFLPGNAEFDIYVPSNAQTAYVSFSQKAFLHGARVLNPEKWNYEPQRVLPILNGQKTMLKSLVNQWLTVSATIATADIQVDAEVMNAMLMQDVLQIATAEHRNESLPSRAERSRAMHICRITRAFVEDRLAVDVLPTMVEICTVVGVSERTLQYAFRNYAGMSPLLYLRLCRLNRARATLRAADPLATTVTRVAMQFGFLHLGRFALDYRQLFNESPSVTLAL